MRFPGAASTALRPLLSGPGRAVHWLGASRSALYLGVTEPDPAPAGADGHPAAAGGRAQPPRVLVILAWDASRLPCGLRLATTSSELPLTELAPPGPDRELAGAVAGNGRVAWQCPAGPVVVTAASEWAPAKVPRGAVAASSLAAARAAVPSHVDGVGQAVLAALGETAGPSAGHPAGARPGASAPAVAALLGRGPGLTPSGDDVLAGFLAGACAFGLAVPGVRQVVAQRAGTATTALSAQLLSHAAAGECIPEVAGLAWALMGHDDATGAARRLLTVGHSSGAALATGLLLAAGRAAQPATRHPVSQGPVSR